MSELVKVAVGCLMLAGVAAVNAEELEARSAIAATGIAAQPLATALDAVGRTTGLGIRLRH